MTYLGLDLDGLTAPDVVTPARFFTQYFNSSAVMRDYAAERGVPAAPGATTVEVKGRRRPASPIEIVPASCWFAPRDSFVYPGGERELIQD